MVRSRTVAFPIRTMTFPVRTMTFPIRTTVFPTRIVVFPVKRAKSYILDCRTHGATPGPWAQAKILTTTKFALTGLTPGQEYSFRVRAVGSAGEGPWSDEAVKMAPA